MKETNTQIIYVGPNCQGSINGITIKNAEGTYGNLYYHYDNGNMLIYGNGDMLGGMNEKPWQSYLTSIKSIRFEMGVKTIGSFDFASATSLENITISSTVTSIKGSAFSGCTNLKNIKYNGISNPCDQNSFQSIGTSSVYVPYDYEDNEFCELTPVRTTDKCGENCFWSIDETTQSLVINGNGKMDDFVENGSPWENQRSIIKLKTLLLEIQSLQLE